MNRTDTPPRFCLEPGPSPGSLEQILRSARKRKPRRIVDPLPANGYPLMGDGLRVDPRIRQD